MPSRSRWNLLPPAALSLCACTLVDPLGDLQRGPMGSSSRGPTPVSAGAFSIDSTEVTVAQYNAFVAVADAGGQPPPCDWNASFATTKPLLGFADNDPVVYVNWCDAYAFCMWAGERLCGRIGGGGVPVEDQAVQSVDQWYSACSNQGTTLFPYGATYEPRACNGPDFDAGGVLPVPAVKTCQGGYPGLYDMSGNVEEWEDSCSANSTATDRCSTRSGSFHDDELVNHRLECTALHDEARNYSDYDIGFRCCKD